MGLVAPQHVESPQTRDQTHVLCIGRWIPIHCATKKVLSILDDRIFAVLFTHVYFTYSVKLSCGFISLLAGLLLAKYFQR